MKDDHFNIYVEQLRDGQQAHVEHEFDSEFIEINEKDLFFDKKVKIKGDAYLAGDGLILHFEISAKAIIPCLICNDPVEVVIDIPDFYHMEPTEEIKTGIFNFKDVVREAILLQTPAFAECDQGKCSRRQEIQKYIANAEQKKNKEGYHPFADL